MPTKLKNNRGKVGPHWEITIPKSYLKELGLSPGEEYQIRRAGQRLLIEPVKEAVVYKKRELKGTATNKPLKQLTGILEIDDPDVEELIAKEAWYD